MTATLIRHAARLSPLIAGVRTAVESLATGRNPPSSSPTSCADMTRNGSSARRYHD